MVEKKKKRERYRLSGGKRVIEVRVRSALQLFDARDPAPFLARDLDDDFADYVIASADELSSSTLWKVLIHVDEAPPADLGESAIREAMKSFFEYQIELKRLQLTKLLRTVRVFLAIGAVVLIICLLLSRLVDQTFPGDVIRPILKEGLVIFGWVSLWRPLELVLFDWYPVYDRIRLLRKLRNAEIDVHFSQVTASR